MKRRVTNTVLILIVLAMTIGLGACGEKETAKTAAGPQKIVMAFLPNEETQEDNKKSNVIMQQKMTEYLGLPVEIVIASDYNGVIEAMRNKKAEIAYFGPFSYIIAHERSMAEAICVMAKGGKMENAFYTSLFITQPDSGIKTLKEAKGRKVAFVDPASTSGNLVPRSMYVRTFGVEPDRIDSMFESVQFSGSHNNSLLAVANRAVDVGSVSSSTWEKGFATGMVTDKEVVKIAESDKIPSSPIAVRGDLPAELKEKIKTFFLTWDNEEYFAIRGREGYRYIAMDDKDYDPIREIAKSMKLTPEDLLK
ncbi:MAG: phosphate/phosphite/phosphonate ABC transporter substrate-binding protein [Spirochaetales bacterium]|nr:phosphate/phosphite/phosphonate ABC transporter substrate-binding protein [Spirochaetales bacterium]